METEFESLKSLVIVSITCYSMALIVLSIGVMSLWMELDRLKKQIKNNS